MTWLLNTWYVAAWDDEVAPGKPCRRTLLDRDILMFRDGSGAPQAILNRCPHRFAPLHLGEQRGDAVHCRYHGLAFNGRGECVLNPHGNGAIPRAARVASYPLVERYSLLWIWLGDAPADPALIPDFGFQDPAHFYVGKRYLHVHANYLLEVDNIMDLSHIQFLHPTTLGGEGVAAGRFETAQDGDIVWSKRTTSNDTMAEYLYRAMNIPLGTRVDRWIDVRWNSPANMKLSAGATPTGQPRAAGVNSDQAHVFTPETAATTHYWYSFTLPKAIGPVAKDIVEQQVQGLTAPFASEDLPMLEAQQRVLGDGDFWAMNPVLLASDGGGVLARRVLERQIKAEQAAGKVSA